MNIYISYNYSLIKNLSPKIVYFSTISKVTLKIKSRITRENRLSILVYRTLLFIYLFFSPPFFSILASSPFILLFPRYGIEDKGVLKVIAD